MSISNFQSFPTITKRYGGTGGAMIDRNKIAPASIIKKAHELSRNEPIIFNPDDWKKITETVATVPTKEKLVSGGSAANTAYIISTMINGLRNNASPGLPAPAWFQGTAVNDKEGKKFTDDLEKAGIENRVLMLDTDKGHTGGVLVTVDDDSGERSMFTSLGVSNNLKPLEKATEEDIYFKDTAIYQAENYTLHDNVDMYKDAFKRTHDAGGQTLISLSNAFLTQRNNKIISDFIHAKDGTHVDIIAGNEDEIATLTGGKDAAKLSNEELLEKAGQFAKDKKMTLIVTLGKEGSAIAKPDGKLIRTDAVKGVKATDTTGAGDSYLGGFIVGRLAGLSLKESANLGSETSAIVVAHEGGPRPPQEQFLPVLDRLRSKMTRLNS